jgi:hypothetical protein
MKQITRVMLVGLALFLSVSGFAKNKRYELQLGQAVMASGTQLKPGTYQVEMDGNSLVFFQGKKEVAKVAVKSEQSDKKVEATTVTVAQDELKSIELGGTKTKLTLE